MASKNKTLAGAPSRFAVLKLMGGPDSDSDDGEENGQAKGTAGKQLPDQKKTQSASAKKKARRKKKLQQQRDAAEEDGKLTLHKRDELDELQYQKDLQEALLASTVQSEETKQVTKKVQAMGVSKPEVSGGGDGGRAHKGRKKHNKEKAVLSVEQFQKLGKLKSGSSDEDELAAPEPPVTRLTGEDADPTFFDRVSKDATRILQREKITEEYKQQYATGSVTVSVLEQRLQERDADVAKLQATVQNQQDELKIQRKRNRELQQILDTVDKREAASLARQLQDVTLVKDELSQQLADASGQLEQERTNNRQLKAELDRIKGSKR